ncbi:Transmembrane protein 65-like [Oopsacas minuta]|uniref:Transmembrane protein 65-like n=1 Tax=Oopsacas minuta TaxID=111878 RepID=A0AAV7JQP5_9METZ|nr:Transmembrane protein 65-like [Oopsacas minuta]
MLNILSRTKTLHKPANSILFWFVRTKKTKFPLSTTLDIPIKSSRDSDDIVNSWTKKEQDYIINSLKRFRKHIDLPADRQDKLAEPPTRPQLRRVALQAALPFIVFGFLDNAIMILSGQYIEKLIIRMALGIGTMTAAAIGNILADMCSVGIADRVENLFVSMGLPALNLTVAQTKLRATKLAVLWGRVLGILVGCTLGMAPLLFTKSSNNVETIH